VSVPVAWLRNRRERRRVEALLRVGQVSRLNTLGELAGGIAHELNQPLAAVLANAQAARRLLEERPPALETARDAMRQAATQARRAADVVARLRRLLESPDESRPHEAVRLDAPVREVLEVLEPEARRREVRTAFEGEAPPVLADRVALEQIVHNLIVNAMHALEDVPASERRLLLKLGTRDGRATLAVRDSGPGIPPEALPRLFEPFFTTRPGGLGLGLSLCETLAQSMQGRLQARNVEPRGAEFVLALPLAAGP
jgi:C4-dicarboxylate-specific signal transduction histidine kinase